jgi:hypothetical protein
LRRYATSRKVASSIPDEVIYFLPFIQGFQPHCGPGIDSAFNRIELQKMFLGVLKLCDVSEEGSPSIKQNQKTNAVA